jgi:sugar O-acyltransferase (sialic acid O-acetyltransferase NeuD family)
MRKSLKGLIYGASPLGKSIKLILDRDGEIDVIGFIDDYKERGSKFCGLNIIGDFSYLAKLKSQGINAIFFGVGYTNMKLRGELLNRVRKGGFVTPNVVHSSALIDETAILGSGDVIFAGVIIDSGVEIGDNVLLHVGSIVGHDTKIHENVFISVGVTLAGFAEVHEETFIGAGSTIMDQITIGRNAVVGAGSVVIKDVPDNSVVAGVPAKIVRYNMPERVK